ncbi:MAG TPA: hypothetical protein PK520_08755 [Exilispira sp.]|nr:hypothetical protein [Exilispira sp.]
MKRGFIILLLLAALLFILPSSVYADGTYECWEIGSMLGVNFASFSNEDLSYIGSTNSWLSLKAFIGFFFTNYFSVHLELGLGYINYYEDELYGTVTISNTDYNLILRYYIYFKHSYGDTLPKSFIRGYIGLGYSYSEVSEAYLGLALDELGYDTYDDIVTDLYKQNFGSAIIVLGFDVSLFVIEFRYYYGIDYMSDVLTTMPKRSQFEVLFEMKLII